MRFGEAKTSLLMKVLHCLKYQFIVKWSITNMETKSTMKKTQIVSFAQNNFIIGRFQQSAYASISIHYPTKLFTAHERKRTISLPWWKRNFFSENHPPSSSRKKEVDRRHILFHMTSLTAVQRRYHKFLKDNRTTEWRNCPVIKILQK